MIQAQSASGGPIKYYSEVLDKVLRESEQLAENESTNDHPEELEALASQDDIDELTRCHRIMWPSTFAINLFLNMFFLMLQYLTFSRVVRISRVFSFNCSCLSGLLTFDDNEEPETMIENEVRELFKLITSLR